LKVSKFPQRLLELSYAFWTHWSSSDFINYSSSGGSLYILDVSFEATNRFGCVAGQRLDTVSGVLQMDTMLFFGFGTSKLITN
jgi:hypothetical protein